MQQQPVSIDEIYLAALELPGNVERAAFLDQACAGNPAQRQRVERLLRAQPHVESYLESVAAPFAITTTEPRISEEPGSQIGHYKLLEQIGVGGFGIVYMAEQTAPVRRKVALKVLKLGMDTREVIARFEAERQALAIMDHPNIAKVHDGGATPSGRPYFVMELVKGVPITDYCDENQLPPRERLELFISVCQAVQHAHQKGIIHRDLKPSNVMVTVHDTRPVVKVIDFGVAKALGQELTEKTLFTGFAQMVGTPLYMSPEQAGQSGLDIDTRSDVYSLGVLLYELLTGTTPFSQERLKEAAYEEIRRIIREEEPPRPSVRISTLRNAETATKPHSFANRKPPLPAVLGELDWIVMKALEKDRNRRYESAGALARDIERHLRDEPVQACPPSNWYRFRKFARRNKSVLATASVVGLAVLLALATLTASTLLIANALQRERQALAGERSEAYFQRITVAHHELSTDNLAATLRALQACPEGLRGWEWHYLMRLCKVESLILQDSTEVSGVAFSPDGERIASAGRDGKVRIRDGRTGRIIQEFRAHEGSACSVVFHPDGRHLATAGADRLVKVWDLAATDQEVFQGACDAIRPMGAAYTVAFRSPDGRHLAAGSDGELRVWDWKKNRPQDPEHTFPGPRSHSIPVAFTRDGRRLATDGPEGPTLWDAETGGPLGTLWADRSLVSALAFSTDGRLLASAHLEGIVELWDTTTDKLLQTMPHTGSVMGVALSSDGRRLASAGEDKTVHIWDVATGREILGLRGHTDRCTCVAFSPDGWRLASASHDGTIRVWDATPLRGDEGQEMLTFTQHHHKVRSVAVSPNGERIVSAGADRLVKVWDAATGRESFDFTGQSGVVFAAAWHPDSRRIATAGSDGGRQAAVKVWDASDGRVHFEISVGRDSSAKAYFAVAFSPDRRHLVTGKVDGAVQVWDAETGDPVRTLGTHDREIRALVFSKGGEHLASASGDGRVYLWDATRLDEEQEPRLSLQARVPGPSVNVAFSPDGRRLATGREKNTVRIWDVQTGEKLQTLEGEHSGEVHTLAFSPDEDGRWIATAGEDSAVKLWDSHTGTFVRSFRGHTGLVSSLAFSPDGRRLVSGSRDTTVKVWDMTQLSESERKP